MTAAHNELSNLRSELDAILWGRTPNDAVTH
jgi:hypothetical protein